jgi:hypothetical protein
MIEIKGLSFISKPSELDDTDRANHVEGKANVVVYCSGAREGYKQINNPYDRAHWYGWENCGEFLFTKIRMICPLVGLCDAGPPLDEVKRLLPEDSRGALGYRGVLGVVRVSKRNGTWYKGQQGVDPILQGSMSKFKCEDIPQ